MTEAIAETDTAAERDPHRCGWGDGCANPDLRDKDNPKPALIIDGVICEGCMWRLTKAVRWMPKDWFRLKGAIGDRGAAAGQRVHGTRDPGIPLNVATEALMRRLVDAVDRAASVVENELGMTGVARFRSDSPPDGRTALGYIAARGKRHTVPGDAQTVAGAVRTLTAALDVLVEAEPSDHVMWLPLPDSDEEADLYRNGQPRELVELSGLDIARELVNVNRHVGMQLGLTYLRIPSDVPCHRCGAETLGRDDGCWDIDCTTCGARYTEDEHGFLIRCLADEVQSRDEDQMLKWLLAEAYYRNDLLRKRTAILADLTDDAIAEIVAGGPEKTLELVTILRGVATQCAEVLTAGDPEWPHPTPTARQIGVRDHEKKTAAQQKQFLATAVERDKAAQKRKEIRKRERSNR